MLTFLTVVAVPALAFVLMLIVGLDLRVEDFRRVSLYPRTVVIAILGQVFLLPLLAVAVKHVAIPNETQAAGMLFLALSPGGAISNYYVHLAGANVALSVTLTAVSTVLSLVSIPVLAAIFLGLMGNSDGTSLVPSATIVIQLGLFVLLPIIVGMLLRAHLHTWLDLWKPRLRIISLFLVGLLLLTSIWTVRAEFVANVAEAAQLAGLFTVGAMLVGQLIARFLPERDRHVVVIECATRNVPIAILIGSSLALQPIFAGFVATYFLVEVLIMIPYALLVRATGKPRP